MEGRTGAIWQFSNTNKGEYETVWKGGIGHSGSFLTQTEGHTRMQERGNGEIWQFSHTNRKKYETVWKGGLGKDINFLTQTGGNMRLC